MNAMFKEIRHGEVDKVRARIENNHDVVNEIFTGKKPLKDIGQSPLQVAIKCGEFEIIDLLIENGADVDFREDPAAVPPHSTCMPLLDDAIIGAMDTLLYGSENIPESEKYVKLIEKLLDKGANPDKKTIPFTYPNGYTPDGKFPLVVLFVHARENFSRYADENYNYPNRLELYEASKKALFDIIDLLKKYGADIDEALDATFGSCTVRAEFVDDFVPQQDETTSVKYHGKEYESVIKGDKDWNAPIRAALKEYFSRKNGSLQPPI